jgi:fructose-1,6-bisphosphatase II
MKNFHLDLLRVTEAGAIAASEWVGRGNKEAADKAATDAMRDRLNRIDFIAEIAIGEGKKDGSFGLYEGEKVGISRTGRWHDSTTHPEIPDSELENMLKDGSWMNDPRWVNFEADYSIAIDPIEGTTPTAKGGYEAMSVIALGGKDAFFKTENFYMNKLAVGRSVVRVNPFGVGLNRSVEENVRCVAEALNKSVNHVTVCVLDRPRHEQLVEELRELGCRIKFIQDCDVTACIATCVEGSGIDLYLGVGGGPEAVIAAAAMKCMGGKFQAQLAENSGKLFSDSIFNIEDLAKGDVMFCATGITDGQLLKGVQFTSRGPVTHSIAMRSESGTIRRMTTDHGN